MGQSIPTKVADGLEEQLLAILAKGADYVSQAVDFLIAEGIRRNVSDIHIDPAHAGLEVRMRIDGVLQQVAIIILSVVVGISLQSLRQVKLVSRRVENDLYMLSVVSRLMSDMREDIRSAERVVAQAGEEILLLHSNAGTISYAAGDGFVRRRLDESRMRGPQIGAGLLEKNGRTSEARVYNAPCRSLRFEYDSSDASLATAITAHVEFEFGDIRRPHVYSITLYATLRNPKAAVSTPAVGEELKGGFNP